MTAHWDSHHKWLSLGAHPRPLHTDYDAPSFWLPPLLPPACRGSSPTGSIPACARGSAQRGRKQQEEKVFLEQLDAALKALAPCHRALALDAT